MTYMTEDGTEGKWQQVQGLARQWWDELSHRNLYGANGKLEPFVDVLQTRYGYTREAAEEEFHRRMAEFEAAKLKHKKKAG